jgi:DNA gyrase subunit A
LGIWRRASHDADQPSNVSVGELRKAVRDCERRLHYISALDRAVEDPVRAFALIVNSDTVEEARAAVQQEYGLDEDQATAILDLQWRRGPRAERAKMRAMRDDLLRHLEELNDLLADRA